MLASDSFSGFLPFVSFNDNFRYYGWLLPRTFFVAFVCGWSGVGSGVFQVWGGDWRSCSSSGDFCSSSRIEDGCGWSRIGDFCGFSIIGGNCSRIGDRTSCSGFGDRGRHASRDIEVAEVDAEATVARSKSIVVHFHWTLLANYIPHSQHCIIWWHFELQVFGIVMHHVHIDHNIGWCVDLDVIKYGLTWIH
jgi:hypothetical protein